MSISNDTPLKGRNAQLNPKGLPFTLVKLEHEKYVSDAVELSVKELWFKK
jgi:hypothetical protein